MVAGVYRWTPTAANTAGQVRFAVRFKAVDASQSEVYQDVQIHIGQSELPPRFITEPVTLDIQEGEPFTVTLVGTDPNPADRANLVFGLVGAVPGSPTLDPKTGVFSWTPRDYVVGAVSRPANLKATLTDGKHPVVQLPINLTVHDVQSVSPAQWALDRCRVDADLRAISGMVKTYGNAASNRRRHKGTAALLGALIAGLSPFSDKVGGSDLPLGMNIAAVVVGIIAERLPEATEREQQHTLLERAHVDLRIAEQGIPLQTGNVTNPDLLQARTLALETRTRATRDLGGVGITLPAASCPAR